ncbi:transmembrane protein 234 homolog [Cimex lectularius]|uniref:Transmembrane protein 234 homolog n=1 Tax=Cimex lectularius TaxID=79782 RepID=A0A8I6RT37_CIMLE|nr:transmembrane protein 234 homolog [Cimex lectularius]
MTTSNFELIKLVLVGFLWGTTNVFLRTGSKGVENVKGDNNVSKTINEIVFLVTNLKYIVPFLLNQLGSLLYFVTLQSSNLTLVVPFVNSLTFAVTAITGWAFNEKMPDKNSLFGLALVTLGIACFTINSVN